ncbi:MAG: hypothetical protein HKN21_13450, partial [Candidatus Eisenbacteria bacterium]|nr:hypothetical protein [Candidatus Eisenbacteria bacterium]
MTHKTNLLGVFLLFATCLATPHEACAEAIPVVLDRVESGWQLTRGGEPYFIQGAGGKGPKAQLAASGANTFRTWGVGDDLQEQLDEAQELGLTVVVGHWLGHERHGFDYGDSAAVQEQFDRVKKDVLQYKDHPAVLLWGIGNEMEGFAGGDNPAIWDHVQSLAAMIKELDPHHPTMTVTADIGGARVKSVHELCPDIDIMGINSYGGLPSIPRRYRELGGTKPILITEFGPRGVWEIEKTSFGAPPELTSTQKAQVYVDAYTAGCLDVPELCLGGFAFTWGFKMEATSTWFGMFLPNGDKLASVDAMTEVWSGSPPANLCPEIRNFALKGPDVVQPGDQVEVQLDIVDPEGAPVQVNWEIRNEATTYITGGDAQAVPLALDEVIQESSTTGAVLKMPGGGVYRLYLIASDGDGGGATASVPIKVDGEPDPAPIRLPLALYQDGHPQPWAPSGWMGGISSISLDLDSKVNPRSGETCIEVVY